MIFRLNSLCILVLSIILKGKNLLTKEVSKFMEDNKLLRI